MARAARTRVVYPIRIFASVAVLGVAAALAAFAGAAVPRAFLALTAALALAFAVNPRPLSRPRRPGLRRAAWIAAAALMLAAIPSDQPRGGGTFGFVIGEAELLVIAVIVLLLLAALVRLVKGIRADAGDRLLVGALGSVMLFAWLFVRVPPPDAVWLYPFGVTLGGALARANGNIRRP